MNSISMNDIIEVCKITMLTFTLILLLCLCGCKSDNSSNYYQTNYGEQCLYAPHTDSYKNLLFCYQENLSKEHAQNKLLNN